MLQALRAFVQSARGQEATTVASTAAVPALDVPDVWRDIQRHLPAADIARLSCVNRLTRQTLASADVWRPHLAELRLSPRQAEEVANRLARGSNDGKLSELYGKMSGLGLHRATPHDAFSRVFATNVKPVVVETGDQAFVCAVEGWSRIGVYELPTLKRRGQLRGHRSYVGRLFAARAGLVSVSRDGTAKIWNPATLRLRATCSLRDCELMAAGDELVLREGASESLAVIDAQRPRTTTQLDLAPHAQALNMPGRLEVWSPADSVVVVSHISSSGALHVRFDLRQRVDGEALPGHAMSFRRSARIDRYLVCEDAAGVLHLVDMAHPDRGPIDVSEQLPQWPLCIRHSNSYLFFWDEFGGRQIWDCRDCPRYVCDLPPETMPYDCSFAVASGHAALSTRALGVRLWRLADAEFVGYAQTGDNRPVRVAAHGNVMVGEREDGRDVVIIDPQQACVKKALTVETPECAFRPKSHTLLSVTDGRPISRLNYEHSGQALQAIVVHGAPPPAIGKAARLAERLRTILEASHLDARLLGACSGFSYARLEALFPCRSSFWGAELGFSIAMCATFSPQLLGDDFLTHPRIDRSAGHIANASIVQHMGRAGALNIPEVACRRLGHYFKRNDNHVGEAACYAGALLANCAVQPLRLAILGVHVIAGALGALAGVLLGAVVSSCRWAALHAFMLAARLTAPIARGAAIVGAHVIRRAAAWRLTPEEDMD